MAGKADLRPKTKQRRERFFGLIPIFEVLGLFNHYVLHAGEESFFARLLHGGSTATSNFNVTAALAVPAYAWAQHLFTTGKRLKS